MPRAVRLSIIAAGIPIVLLGWMSVVFAMDHAADEGEVLGRVTIGEVRLAGLSRAEAITAVKSVEAVLGAEPIPVTIEGTEFTLLPSQVGFDLDEEALVDEALSQGRGGGFLSELKWWLTNLVGGDTHTLALQGTYNRDALLGLLQLWESAAIDDPPLEGGITIQGNVVVPVYPKEGTGLDYEATADLIEAEVLGDRHPVVAVTEFRNPALTTADIDHAVSRAEEMVSQTVTLTKIIPDITLEIPPNVLRESIASRVVADENGRPRLDLFFQIGPLVQYLNPIRAEVETPPVNAQVVIRPDDVPIILEGSNGVLVDDPELPDAVLSAATSVTRAGPLPVRDGAEPELTTADAEALGIRELLYTATTYYLCCGDYKNLNRINNIHRIADEVNGAIIMPGQDWSLNDYVGPRTEEDGYRPAGAVVYGVVSCCDHPANMGGGTSQFATTLYNAAFWAGLGDVSHSPHSIYFTRYPMVREATLGWPEPDVVIRNTRSHAVYIKTEYTDTSITVKIFGDSEGWTVESTTSGRYNPVEPSPDAIYWEADPTMTPDDPPRVTSTGTAGFTADTTRTITFADGTTKVQKWVWTYDPVPIRQSVHPCKLYPSHPDYQTPCPVKVPNVLNLAAADAQAAITGAGLGYSVGDPVPASEGDGTVYSQSVNPGTWVPPGTNVTVHLRQVAAP